MTSCESVFLRIRDRRCARKTKREEEKKKGEREKRCARHILEALAYIHDASVGLVHRDVRTTFRGFTHPLFLIEKEVRGTSSSFLS